MWKLFLKNKEAERVETLKLFNTLSREKEIFTPQKPKTVTLYSCGPTVYDHVQIGNLRSFLMTDLLKRTLMLNGYEVKHTMNLTDFGHLTSDADEGEDKMMIALRRAEKEPTLEHMRAVADPFIESFKEDLVALNIVFPTEFTRASDYVHEQKTLIKTLVEKGYTYETDDGIYFDISTFPTYGTLGKVDLEKLKAGARVEENTEKKHPADFALWKKGELGWESPWGKGFPGWHTECVAMIIATLGKQIDIHTGGEDLKYTHHNGEVAQAESATKKVPFVRYWLHNAFVTIEGRRIGKSEGNALRLQQVRDRGITPLAYRYWLLGGHYRSPMNVTFEALESAKQALFRLRRFMIEEKQEEAAGNIIEKYKEKFLLAVNDDLDTPRALALLWEVVKDAKETHADKVATLLYFDRVLGLNLKASPQDQKRALGVVEIADLPNHVQELLERREGARKEKDWEKADALREEINLEGFLVEDTPNGPQVTKG